MFKNEKLTMKDSYIVKELAEVECLLRKLETIAIDLRHFMLDMEHTEWLPEMIRENCSYRLRELNQYERLLFGINIDYIEPAMVIRVPAIMPHRMTKPDLIYMETFMNALTTYKKENEEEYAKYSDSIQEGVCAIISMRYGNAQEVRDNDNVELKKILDAMVSAGFLKCDGGTYMSLYLCASVSLEEEYNTTIYIVPKNDAIHFFEKNDFLL